ncbi:MAG: S8 family serine peptidase [Deltaproteobacteria bacterium]|nr:S8 family serine peptidase [Deltaproteobacteria bacterium]
MKKFASKIIGFLVVFLISMTVYAADYKPGEVIVKFKSGSALMGNSIYGLSGLDHPVRIAVDDVEDTISDMSKRDDVEYVEPNYKIEAEVIPNDWPYYENEWEDIDLVEAWDVIDGRSPGHKVIIAVVDSGVALDHPDLENILVGGYDFANNDSIPEDNAGHGTKVCGVIGAIGDNGEAVAGVSWNINYEIMPLKFMEEDGGKCTGYISDAIDAIYHAVNNGADIINASWGFDSFSHALEDAITYARDRGVLFVSSAGNSAQDNDSEPHYPSNYTLDNVIAVAAMNRYGDLASFSNYGYYSVDIAAPGVGLSTTTKDGGYTSWASGTSFAAPFVTGIAALVISQFPELGYLEVKDRLLKTSVMDESYSEELLASGGCVNAYNALMDSPLHDIPSAGNWVPPQAKSADPSVPIGGEGGSDGYCIIDAASHDNSISTLALLLFLFVIALVQMPSLRYQD